MADHSLPTTTNAYADVLTYIDARLDDLSRWNGTAHPTPSNLITGAIRWNATTFRLDTWNGTDWNTPLTTRLDITAFNGSIGATTPSTGAFTTLSSNSTTSLAAGTLIGGVAAVTTTGTQTLSNKTFNSTGNVWNGGIIAEAYGGTNSATFAGAPFALKGANTDLTTIANLASFGNTSTTHVRVSTTGLVGINTVADTGVRLHVKDTIAAIKSEGTSGYGSFYATSSTGNPSHVFFGTAGVETGRLTVSSAGVVTISNGSGATQRLWIDAAGLVGIGVASSSHILEITKNQNAPTALVIRNTDAGTLAQSLIQFTNGTKYVNTGIDPTGNYFLTFAAGGIVSKFDRFNTYYWQNVAGTELALLETTGVLSARASVRARSTTGTHGFVSMVTGSASVSGFIEFYSHTGVTRQAYIGASSTNSGTLDGGTLPYSAGTHSFTGDILANNKVGIGVAAGSFLLNVQSPTTTAVARFANILAAGSTELSVASNDRSIVLGQRSSTHASGDLGYIYSATNTPIGIYTNGISRLVVQAAGHTVPGATNTYTLGASGLLWSNIYATLLTGPVTALKSATTSVDVSAAAAPTAGQVLTATNSTTASWATASLGTYFQSADQTVTPNSSLAVAHGLGAKPRLYTVVLKCATAEANYSVGDEAEILQTVPGVSVIALAVDATNVRINYTGANTQVLNKTTQVSTTITSANWKFVVRAWL